MKEIWLSQHDRNDQTRGSRKFKARILPEKPFENKGSTNKGYEEMPKTLESKERVDESTRERPKPLAYLLIINTKTAIR